MPAGGKAIPTVVQFGYDRHKSEGYLGNVGLNVSDGSKYVGEYKDDKPNGQRCFDGDVEIVRSSRV